MDYKQYSEELFFNYKKLFFILTLVVLFVSIVGCADKEAVGAEDAEETVDKTETTEESAADYDPEVVDQLTEDLDNMSW